MTREELIEFAKYLDEGCNLLGEGYIESRTDEYLQKIANKNFVLADVRGQLIAFLRQQTKLHYVSIYENDFEFADKILKAINLP
jgi:hypothetical protein